MARPVELRGRSDTLELVQSVMAESLLDEATKRLAAVIDPTDTDEGMERVQTDLNEAILAAIEGVRDR